LIELLKRLSTVELGINDPPQVGELLVLSSPTRQIMVWNRAPRLPRRTALTRDHGHAPAARQSDGRGQR